MFEVSTTSFQRNVDKRRPVAERTKFAKHVMLFAGVCFGGKGRLHFIPETAKVNAKLYVETLLPELVQDCRSVLLSGFIFQQDGAPANTAKLAKNSLVNMNGLRTCLTSTLWTTMSGELCLNATSYFKPSRRTSMSSRKFCSWYGMGPAATYRTRSTKPYWASRKDFGLARKLVVDWWTLRTYAKMSYLSHFGICNNSQCFLTMIIPCKIENMA